MGHADRSRAPRLEAAPRRDPRRSPSSCAASFRACTGLRPRTRSSASVREQTRPKRAAGRNGYTPRLKGSPPTGSSGKCSIVAPRSGSLPQPPASNKPEQQPRSREYTVLCQSGRQQARGGRFASLRRGAYRTGRAPAQMLARLQLELRRPRGPIFSSGGLRDSKSGRCWWSQRPDAQTPIGRLRRPRIFGRRSPSRPRARTMLDGLVSR